MYPKIMVLFYHKNGGTSVADHMSQTIFFLQNLFQFRIQHARNTIDSVIGRHNALRLSFHNTTSENIQVIFIFISGVHGCIYKTTVAFHVICIEMLQCCSTPNIKRIISLHTLNIGPCHFSRQVRIFSVPLFIPAPSGIPFQVHGGSPSGQTCPGMSVRNHTCFCTGHFSGPFNQFRIPSSTHANGLWKRSRNVRLSQAILVVSAFHTMSRFSANSQSWNSKSWQI